MLPFLTPYQKRAVQQQEKRDVIFAIPVGLRPKGSKFCHKGPKCGLRQRSLLVGSLPVPLFIAYLAGLKKRQHLSAKGISS